MYNKKIELNEQTSKILTKMIKARIVPFLIGEPGIGKSSFIKSIATKMNTEMFTIVINQVADTLDLTGSRIVVEEGIHKQTFFPHKTLADAIQYAKNNKNKITIIFFDEINRNTPELITAVMSYITQREVGNEQFPENIRFITAGNDSGDVLEMDSSNVSRIAKLYVKPSIERLITKDNINKLIKKAIKKNIKNINIVDIEKESDEEEFEGEQKINILQSTNPRTIKNLSNFLDELGIKGDENYNEYEIIKENITILQQIVCGIIGKTDLSKIILNEIINHSNVCKNKKSTTDKKIKNLLTKNKTTKDLEEEISKMSFENKKEVYINIFNNDINNNINKEEKILILNIIEKNNSRLLNESINEIIKIKNIDKKIIEESKLKNIIKNIEKIA